MKKRFWVSWILLFFIIWSIFYNSSIKEYYIPIWKMGITILIPTLVVPIFFLELFFSSGGFYHFLNGISSFQRKKKVYLFFLIVLGIISGAPTLALLVDDGIKNKILTSKEGTTILSFFLFPSFPYLYYIWVQNPSWFLYLFLPVFLSFMGFFLFFQMDDTPIEIRATYEKIELTKIFHQVFIKLGNILGTYLFFSLPGLFFQQIPLLEEKLFLQGIFEFSYPIYQLLQIEKKESALLMSTILSFSSCSIFYQTHHLCPKVSIKKIVRTRFILAIMVFLFFQSV